MRSGAVRFSSVDMGVKAVGRLHFPQRGAASQLQKKYLAQTPATFGGPPDWGRLVAYD
jgi:hypothetical protein